VLLWCKARIEEGEPGSPPGGARRVLYGDTDSLFVESGLADADEARAFGSALAQRLTGELASHVRSRWRVESRLELAFDRLYLRLCLPAMRHSSAGARKRYAGLVWSPSGDPRVVFTGMEAVRGDWTDLARQVQRELYARLFAEAPAAVAVVEYLRGVVEQLRSGALDAQLVYRKGLRKPPEAYTTTTPPHVAAARLAGQRRGRIAYVITTAGPRPAAGEAAGGRGEPRARLDYDHYIETQLRAVAQPVLLLLGLEFESVVGSRSPGRQLPLF
jgi:DNA polymerase-2